MATYEASFAGIGEMLRAGFMVADMEARAEKVAALARATAPVYGGRDDAHRGRYRADFTVSSTDHGGAKGRRAAGIVTNNDPAAFEIEMGTSETPAHYTLRRALAAAQY